MDKPASTPGADAFGELWPENAEGEFHATGLFGKSAPAGAGAGSAPESDEAKLRKQDLSAPAAPKSRAEPVVHKFVLDEGARGESPDILDRMRSSAAPRSAPSDPAAGGGNPGFTQLLRALGTQPISPPIPPPAPPPVAAAPRPPAQPFEAPTSEPRPAQNEASFTTLLRSLSAEEMSQPSVPRPAPPTIQEPSSRAAAPAGSGGFTELLRMVPASDSAADSPRQPSPKPSFSPAPASPRTNEPGEFTRLFSSLEAGPRPPAPQPPPSAEGSGSPSFTRMLAMEPGGPKPGFAQEEPDFGGGRYAAPDSPRPSGPIAPARTMEFGSSSLAEPPLAEPSPLPSSPSGGGVGITRLIRLLDEPAAPPPGVAEQAPQNLSGGTEQPGATFSMASPAAPPSATAGPSEYTRILDASRMREFELSANRGAGAAQPVAPPQAPPGAAMPGFQPPQFQPPQAPAPGAGMAMPGFQPPQFQPVPGMPYAAMPPAAAPHAGGYPPMPGAQMPAAAMAPNPQGYIAGGAAAATPRMPGAPAFGGMPQMPVAPAPPPPAPAAQPPLGKAQQFVPLLLVLIILLLVGLLVTVIFLMKH